MTSIRLIREVLRPLGSGPSNGQYALQKALRAGQPEWLKIGGTLRSGEIPWFWSWQDRIHAARCAAAGRPFIVGPNVLFEDSRRPCHVSAERAVCNAASCRLMFTESEWYRDLIEQYRGPGNRAPIVLWPYPIDPKPGGPLTVEYDLLIYAKGNYPRALIARLARHVARVRVLVYGRYRREELFEAARRSRCCMYLSTDDRGPLALAEILLSGCPTIGVPRGAPFIQPGQTGILLDDFRGESCQEAIAQCHQLDRPTVATLTCQQFDTAGIVKRVVSALHDSRQPLADMS
ncbi:MAG: hypothetical protein A2V70_01520 [Planctomycetes bacterium RBG_13_63_9]|nr:MAG: hypothetical protein A2V70_01520 [Planctomycetes bacterium RBG_13_63_9]